MKAFKLMTLTLAVILSLSSTVSAIQQNNNKAAGALRAPANGQANHQANKQANHQANTQANKQADSNHAGDAGDHHAANPADNHGANLGDNHGGNFNANHHDDDSHRNHDDLHRDHGYGYGVPVVPVGTPYGTFAASCNQDGADYCTESASLCPQTVFQVSCVCYTDGTCATASGTNWCNACTAGNVVSVKDNFACGAC